MMNSRFNSFSIPRLDVAAPSGRAGGSNARRAPALLVAASKRPLRVVVRNTSFAAEVYLAFDAATLQSGEPGANTYELNAGMVDTFMLAPEQELLAMSLSDGAKVSIAISEALPIDTKP